MNSLVLKNVSVIFKKKHTNKVGVTVKVQHTFQVNDFTLSYNGQHFNFAWTDDQCIRKCLHEELTSCQKRYF